MATRGHAKGRDFSIARFITIALLIAGAGWWIGSQGWIGGGKAPLPPTDASSGNRAHHKTSIGSPTSSTTSTSTTTTTPPISSPFGGAIEGYVGSRSGTVTAALYNVSTGQTFELNPDARQDEASIVKVDIMGTLLSQMGNTTTPIPTDQQQLLTSMIEDSDNDSATTLWDQVGGPGAISAFNARIGMPDTTPSPCVTCSNFPWPGWGLTTTSAADQVTLLRQFVFPSSLLTPAQQSYGLSLMESIIPSEDWGVSGGVPSGVTIALKNGWLPLSGESDWQVNSIGWISGDGRNYIVAILDTGNPTEQYGIDTINQMSGQIWGELG
jgi:beta-lactamase class A